MNKAVIIIIAVAAFFVILFGVGCSQYNTMVDKEEDVNQKWGNLQSQYDTRARKIPDLVKTVKAAAAHESTTLQNVTEARTQARAEALSLSEANLKNFDVNNLTDEQRNQYMAAQEEYGRNAQLYVNAVVEAYPTITATIANYEDLQHEIAGCYNRVNIARIAYNEAVTNYNIVVRRFPGSLFAGMFGFSPKAVYTAPVGSENEELVSFES